MGFFDSVVGSIFDIGKDIVGGVMQHRENEDARDWSEKMSNTSHQREVKDLEAAGLNPVLSAMGGAGANVPAASNAPLPQLRAEISSALSLKKQIQEIEVLKKTGENIEAQTRSNWSDKDMKDALASKARMDTVYTAEKTKQVPMETANIQQDIRNKKANEVLLYGESGIQPYLREQEEASATMFKIEAERILRSFNAVDQDEYGKVIYPFLDRMMPFIQKMFSPININSAVRGSQSENRKSPYRK